MQLPFDPTLGEPFWDAIRAIPGFPRDEQIPLKTIRIASGAFFELPRIIRQASPGDSDTLVVVMDTTPMRRGGDSLKPLVIHTLRQANWEPEVITLEPDASGQVHTTMAHIRAMLSRLRPDASVLSVGSGVVTDIAKHACYLYEQETNHRLPFVVYQTANSVNAFSSNMAPVFIEGVKRTLPSRYCDALVCDLETLCDAPQAMTLAGVGDQLAPLVSFADWRLANLLGLDPSYCELPRAVMQDIDRLFLEHADDIRNCTPAGMDLLARVITLGGLAVSLVHATTPLSGYEHVISHTLDLANESRGKPLALHGSQVALCAILSAEAWQVFLDEFEPSEVVLESCYPSPSAMEEHIRQVFLPLDLSGGVAKECWADYQVKLESWRANRLALEGFLEDWQAIREEIRGLASPPGVLKEILAMTGAPSSFAELDPPLDEAEVKFAFLNAPLIRRRLTLGDLLLFLGWDREALWRRIWPASQKT
jgi:glycerol-1-phosphate dehydrogenase [NAD(P)+]